jgi:hypothetical protein
LPRNRAELCDAPQAGAAEPPFFLTIWPVNGWRASERAGILVLLRSSKRGKRQSIEDHDIMRQISMTLALATVTSLSATAALAHSDRVKKDCAGDYQNFCSQYAPDTAQLRSCFESNRKGLTQICIRALVDAGEVPAKYLKK